MPKGTGDYISGPFGPDAYVEGWNEAASLFNRLTRGDELSPYHPSGLVLEPDEISYGEGTAEYSRFYGMQVQYTERSAFAFGGPVFVAATLIGTALGNAAARRSAEILAAPQWRTEGYPRILLTNRRMLVHSPVNYQWLSFWHSSLLEFGPQVGDYAIYLGYPECAPVLLRGPVVPWLSVVFAFCVYPRNDLINLPFFNPFIMASQTGLAGSDAPESDAPEQVSADTRAEGRERSTDSELL
jgi:hypothetical protein